MELVYLWVEDYKNIHEQGFNFSSRFNCDYNKKTNELTIEENDDYIPDFFGENINVTAIVGKNGSGKSSLSEIFQALTIINPIFGRSEVDFNYMLLLKIDKNNFTELDKNYILVKNIEIDNYDRSMIQEYDGLDEFIKPLFLDSELPYNKYNEYDMAGNNFPNYPNFEDIKELVYIDLDYNSISKKLLKLQIIDFSFINFSPETITVQPDNKSLDKKRDFMVYDYHRRPRFDSYIIEKVDRIIEQIIDMKGFFLFSQFLEDIDDFSQSEVNTILDNLKGNEDDIEKILLLYTDKLNNNALSLSLLEYESILCEDKNFLEINKELLIKYFEYIDIQVYDNKKRSFFKLSHGEKMFFGIAINILYFIQSEKNESEKSDSYLLYFDEPDLSLHPNWQKQYINRVLNLFKEFDRNIHLLFTTHSPFLLSDIPKQNIIFLDTYNKEDKEVKNEEQNIGNCKVLFNNEILEKKQTFGANIHTLLSDSFFMEDGLMGEFAKQKINKIIAFFDNENELYKNDQDKLLKIINSIGEAFLKEKLLFMYNEKYPKTDEEKILELEKQIASIKNGQD